MAEVLRTEVSKRYLGLELFGARNQRTAMAAIEYFPREKKVFLLDIYDRIATREHQTSDEALIESILEMGARISRLAVHAPLSLPPCIECRRKSCPLPGKCTVPAVRHMRETTKKHAIHGHITPYTQRPVEIYIKNEVVHQFEPALRFEVEEGLGANKSPLTARMQFLKRHLERIEMIEVWPKLSVLMLARKYGLQKRALKNYRSLEKGLPAREEILEALIRSEGIFIYDRDFKKLAGQLASFDAFICALTGLLFDQGLCVKPPRSFPANEAWVAFPHT